MKKIIPALALLLFTSPVHAGELDGKAIYCPATVTGYYFDRKTATELRIGKNSEVEHRFFVDQTEYTTGLRYVKWSANTKYKKIKKIKKAHPPQHWRLDRQTLKMRHSGRTYQCHLSNKAQIRSKLKAVIARAKRKNKL